MKKVKWNLNRSDKQKQLKKEKKELCKRLLITGTLEGRGGGEEKWGGRGTSPFLVRQREKSHKTRERERMLSDGSTAEQVMLRRNKSSVFNYTEVKKEKGRRGGGDRERESRMTIKLALAWCPGREKQRGERRRSSRR